jgi:hypothetical protein
MPAAGAGVTYIGSLWLPPGWDFAKPYPVELLSVLPPRPVWCDPDAGRAQIWTTVEGEKEAAPVAALVDPEIRPRIQRGLRALEASLLEWIRTFKLEPWESWIGNDALKSLRYWGAGRTEAWLCSVPLGTPTIIGEDITLHIPAWNVASEQRATARKRMETAAGQAISAHLDEMERLAGAAGLKPIPRKRRRLGKAADSSAELALDLDCLVRSRVKGVSNKRLAAEKGRTPQAIAEAIKRAELLLATGSQSVED